MLHTKNTPRLTMGSFFMNIFKGEKFHMGLDPAKGIYFWDPIRSPYFFPKMMMEGILQENQVVFDNHF